MIRKQIITTVAAAFCLLTTQTSSFASNTSGSHAGKETMAKHTRPHWAYSGPEGPAYWGNLTKEFSTCSKGRNQSPINIQESTIDSLFKLEFHYNTVPMSILNNGHTIQINYSNINKAEANTVKIANNVYALPNATQYNSSLNISGETYKLLQIHFHSPSEHEVAGKSYALEAHFVHMNAQKQLAVVSVLFKRGRQNTFIQKLWNNMPTNAGAPTTYNQVVVNASDLLPANKSYYHYRGSLTTPPCSEGVRWFVMRNHLEVSDAQVARFNYIIGNNNRPTQARNQRFLLHN